MSKNQNDAEAKALVLGERMMARLRLRHLRLLASLERSTTLREAAREVGITQPAASQVLRELEEMLEVQLFERHARGLRATDAGRFLAQQSRQMLGGVAYAAEALASVALGYERPLQIGALPSAIAALVRPQMTRLRQQLVGWKVSFQEGQPNEVLASLQGGLTQLALLRRPNLVPEHRLTFTELLSDELVVVASPAHPAVGAVSIDLADLAPYPWSLPTGPLATALVFEDACRSAGLVPKRAALQSMAASLILPITSDAETLAAIPRSIVGAWLESGALVKIDLRATIPLPPLGALHHADDTSAAVHKVIAVLRD
ncbi:hypothetical protein ASF19_00345 [Acidovorax sp. Leaf84]|uniref:LysR family transcriptional regulator n=1 Tax=Acidovorax sp. Leaf84 TaxID=1736240 RepID=UPI0006F434E9|nr:LysR family transcriptional regulator [Acidovorax sp. Leaf84]KQO40149.1 hypothetical protein ASF19_00345 [Acidovorax sp. Leaf84]